MGHREGSPGWVLQTGSSLLALKPAVQAPGLKVHQGGFGGGLGFFLFCFGHL